MLNHSIPTNHLKCAIEHHAFYRLKTADIDVQSGKPQRQNFVRMGSRFKYSGKTEFQSTMMRAQQLNQSNENRSNFERRPSQRFASRRSRTDRTRPNITSSASASALATTTNNNRNINGKTMNTSEKVDTNHQNNQTTPSNTRRENYASLPNLNPTEEQANHHNQTNNNSNAPITKHNAAINNSNHRHQMLNIKPVKPPTLPTNASFSITPQSKSISNQPKSNSSEISVNNNNNIINNYNHQYSNERRSSYVESDCGSSIMQQKPDLIIGYDAKLTNESDLNNQNSKSQPILPMKQQTSQISYKNYKAPESLPPPPPPPPKAFESGAHEDEKQHNIRKPEPPSRRINRSSSNDHNQVDTNNMNHSHNHNNGAQRRDIKHAMPPPPPPPMRPPPRSIQAPVQHASSSDHITQDQHMQNNLVKSICVTEL